MGYIDAGQKTAPRCSSAVSASRSRLLHPPTVFTDVKDDMKIAKEEIFGPVMSILKFKEWTR